MKKELSEGCFSMKGNRKYAFSKFVRSIATWSYENMLASLQDAKSCGLSSALQSSGLSSLPLGACLISYHAAVYIVILIEHSGFPVELSDDFKSAIISDILKILDDRNTLIFSPNEEKIIAILIPRYLKSIVEFIRRENLNSITFGPGGDVLADIEKIYGVAGPSLGMEALTKFPMVLNTSIPGVLENLVQKCQCKWESIDGGGIGRGRQEIIEEFGLSSEEFTRIYEAYNFSLNLNGKKSNWNDDVDGLARSIGALTDEEMVLARSSIERAILNRIILRFFMEK